MRAHSPLLSVDVMSEELDWELADIFDGGMFAFPVYESSDARRVVRYLLMRGVLPEEVASAIEQPGSTTDLIGWLAGDERKSMVGVWAMAWLNDARGRYDRRRTTAVPADVPPTSGHVVVVHNDFRFRPDAPPPPPSPPLGGGRRQMSLDSDFGGSGDWSAAGSRKGSFGDGLSSATDCSDDHATTTDDDDVSAASDVVERRRGLHRRRPQDIRVRCVVLDDTDALIKSRNSGADDPLSRPRSDFFDVDDCEFFAGGVDPSDSGNVSDVFASACALDATSGGLHRHHRVTAMACGGVCRCTLAHYTTSSVPTLDTVDVDDPAALADVRFQEA